MTEFLDLVPPPEALDLLLAQLSPEPSAETVDSAVALGRVTFEPVVAALALPSFQRSTVDGYAVRAADTYGATESLPAYLEVAGEIPMGAASSLVLEAGRCALIHTGGMLPKGADAVVMVEHTQSVREGEVEFLKAVAVGDNVLQVGEDVGAGDEVIPAGTRLRPAEIGGLMALGITKLEVARPPRVGIISSGDEVVPPDQELAPGQVYDVNSYTLSALVTHSGGTPVPYGIIPDEEAEMRLVAQRAVVDCDLLVLTAGSSISARDLTARVIDSLGEPGVLVHGVNVRPGKPTILGICQGKAVIGLPGNPVSALVIAGLFVVPIIDAWLGVVKPRPQPTVSARLSVNLASQSGREDWVPVRLVRGEDGLHADPVFGKSNLIFTLARADGLVCIPADANGLAVGEIITVMLM